jgi:hypothetical protein
MKIELTEKTKEVLTEIKVYYNLTPSCNGCPFSIDNECIFSPMDIEGSLFPYHWKVDKL